MALRKREPVFRRRRFLRGERIAGSLSKDIAWFRPDGKEMAIEDWQSPKRSTLALLLAGDALGWMDEFGTEVVGDSFLVMLNASAEEVVYTMPGEAWGERWELVVDTADDEFAPPSHVTVVEPGDHKALVARSLVVLRRTAPVRGSWRPRRAGA